MLFSLISYLIYQNPKDIPYKAYLETTVFVSRSTFQRQATRSALVSYLWTAQVLNKYLLIDCSPHFPPISTLQQTFPDPRFCTHGAPPACRTLPAPHLADPFLSVQS